MNDKTIGRIAERLDKIIANAGFCSRNEVKKLVRMGAIIVNGEVVKDSAAHFNPDDELLEIKVNGKIIDIRQLIYLMMNKPAGLISATFDPQHKTVIDILPEKYQNRGLFPAGRLDGDTEGLLLLTNDGHLAHELLAPKNHVPKKYLATIERPVNESDILAFKNGIILDDGYKALSALLEASKQKQAIITVYEGKFHLVKRMFEATGNKVLYLKRLEMGGLLLDKQLAPGEFRELTIIEISALKNKK